MKIELFRCFDRNKAHGRALHCFHNRFRVQVVILIGLYEARDELSWNEAYLMALCNKAPADLMSTTAGFHTEPAGRHVSHVDQELCS